MLVRTTSIPLLMHVGKIEEGTGTVTSLANTTILHHLQTWSDLLLNHIILFFRIFVAHFYKNVEMM